MVESGGETTSEAEEEVISEVDEVEVQQMSVVEEIIRTQVIQVAKGLINKKSNVITIRSLVIMHMNAGRNNMTKEGKAQFRRPKPALIQMEIGGYPPIPLAQNNCPLWQFPSYFSIVFRVLNFRGRFEALNDFFWRFEAKWLP